MWNRFIRKHFSDEELLAYADGEVSTIQASRVKSHLPLCWHCRNRLSELEAQTQIAVKMLRDDHSSDPERTGVALSKFFASQQEFEHNLVSAPPTRAASPVFFRTAIAALASLAILGVGLGLWSRHARRTISDSEVLLRSESADETLLHTPELVHQIFKIRIAEIKPRQLEHTGKIEVWSYSNGRRFTSRWSNSKGVLQQAVWRSLDDSVYVYNPAVGPDVVARKDTAPLGVRSLVDLSAYTRDEDRLEQGLMEWLETRDWRPIALSSDIRAFIRQDGAALRAVRGPRGVYLQAQGVVSGVRVTLSLLLDDNSYEPRVKTIRFEGNGSIIELQLTGQECTFAKAPSVVPAVFEPHLPPDSIPPEPVAAAFRSTSSAGESESAHAALPAVHLEPARIDQTALEIEVRYALHRARACLGEPIDIVEGKPGENPLEVRGLVENAARKGELLAVLAEFPIRTNIRTVDEELAGLGPTGRPQTSPNSPESDPALRLSNRNLPIQPLLEQIFDRDRFGPPAAERIASLTTRAVSVTQEGLFDAWALRHLAEDYGDYTKSDLSQESRWLLEVMVQDHMRDLRRETESLSALLDPVLSSAPKASNSTPWVPSPGETPSLEWPTVAGSIFETTQNIYNLVRTLFAGTDSPQSDINARPAADLTSVQKAIGDLSHAILLQKARFEWEVASQNGLLKSDK